MKEKNIIADGRDNFDFVKEAAKSAVELLELLSENDWDTYDVGFIMNPLKSVRIQVTVSAKTVGDDDEKEN